VQRSRGLAEVSKTKKSSIVEGDRWNNIERFGRKNFGRFSKRKQGSSQSCKEIFQSRPLNLEIHVGKTHIFWRKKTSEKSEEEET
jgi:hypothetical protein